MVGLGRVIRMGTVLSSAMERLGLEANPFVPDVSAFLRDY
jgi:hypothetical protein